MNSLLLLKQNVSQYPITTEDWLSLTPKLYGAYGETLVCSVLEQNGFIIHKRNWRTPFAEIDFVAKRGSLLLIGEVKTRFQRVKNRPLSRELAFWQRQRLARAATWVWFKERRQFSEFACLLFIVTKCGIKTVNLPLLYDQN
jgi:Holliday junction resolvase-like predicted endonuclease